MAMTPEERRLRNNAAAKRWRERHPERAKAADAAWKARNPDQCRAWARRHTRRKLGITDATFEQRSGPCPICPYVGPLVCDHWHDGPKKGQVRGWICNSCNLGLGRFGDSAEGLESALRYMRGDATVIEPVIRQKAEKKHGSKFER